MLRFHDFRLAIDHESQCTPQRHHRERLVGRIQCETSGDHALSSLLKFGTLMLRETLLPFVYCFGCTLPPSESPLSHRQRANLQAAGIQLSITPSRLPRPK